MGIYSNGHIFGIQIYSRHDDAIAILFEAKDAEMASYSQIREAYLFYDTLQDKNNIFFNMHNEYTSTYGRGTDNFMMWLPLPVDTFLQLFQV